MPRKRIGLFLGRFQPFHNAHRDIAFKSFDFVEFLIIGVGSSQYSLTKENPFTYNERREMIEKSLQDSKDIKVMPIPDIHDPINYVQYVKKTTAFFPFDVVFTDNQNTIDLFKEKGYPIIIIPIPNIPRATDIRECFYKGEDIWRNYVPHPTELIMDRERKKILDAIGDK